MRPFVVGTAGHVDHGKSALVRALTGTDPDRLPEEKRRGITIELGFAHGAVAPDVDAAYVDVPGHERLVKTMVAGAHGLDVVLLVAALDEGVMPQTREHAAVCRFLAVPRAVLVLTKADLLPQLGAERVAEVTAALRGLGAPFADAPAVVVSARTGEGLDALKDTLAGIARNLPERLVDSPALLPIDRAFTIRGHGTVVTGTLVAGTLGADDAVELAGPAPKQVAVRPGLRARSVQVHGRGVVRAQAGQRVAVNLPGVEVADVPRGAVLVSAGTAEARAGAVLDVVLSSAPDAPELKNRSRLVVHLGTASALATVDLLGKPVLAAGESSVAQLRLDRALVAARDQRFVLRGFAGGAAGHTVAGGRVLVPGGKRRRAADRRAVERLAVSAIEAGTVLVEESGARGVAPGRLQLALGTVPVEGVTNAGGRLFATATLERLAQGLRELVRARRTVPREEARATLGAAPEAFAWAVERLGPGFTLGDALAVVTLGTNPVEERVARALAEGGLSPPTQAELATKLRMDAKAVGGAVRALAKAGRAVRLTDELFMDAEAAHGFRRRVEALLRDRGEATTLELKALAGTTRKYLIPLVEWLDQAHVTLRVGEVRRLRRAGGA